MTKHIKSIKSSHLKRRLELLVAECRVDDPCYDDVLKGAMYTISHYATVGKLTVSKPTKKLNENISVEADQLRSELRRDDPSGWFETFHKLTTNEHQLPLKNMWRMIVADKNNITVDSVWELFCKYPYVTVTKKENRKLSRNLRPGQTPESRYKEAGIEIMKVSAC